MGSWNTYAKDGALKVSDVDSFGCITYVQAPTGNAAVDTAAIQEAHDSLPSTGGAVVLCRGGYVLDPATPLAFSKPIYLKGAGRSGTNLAIDSATVTPIGVTAHECIFEDFSLTNTHATAPTAGAGIAVTGGGNRTRYRDIEVKGFYICLDQQYGNGWAADKCTLFDFASTGLKIQNLDAPDSGDGLVTNCQIASTIVAQTIGIDFWSGGNLRVLGNQLYSGIPSGHTNIGMHFAPPDGVNTSDFLIIGNSIESFDYGIVGALPGGATGELQVFIIQANELFCNAGVGACINFDMSTPGRFSEFLIGGNRLYSAAYGLLFGNIDQITFGPNIYGSNSVAAFADAGGTTNKVQVANG